MSRGIFVGTQPPGPATFDIDVSGFFASLWSIQLSGTGFNSSVLNLLGGDGVNFEFIKVTDDRDSSHATLLISLTTANIGTYFFEAMCSHLRFIFVGGSGDLSITLFPEPRH